MSVFKFPKELCNEIQSFSNRFCWGHANDSKKIRLCTGKLDGGLDFQNLEDFNVTLFPHRLWRLLLNKNALVSRQLKDIHDPHCSLLNATLRYQPSSSWRSS